MHITRENPFANPSTYPLVESTKIQFSFISWVRTRARFFSWHMALSVPLRGRKRAMRKRGLQARAHNPLHKISSPPIFPSLFHPFSLCLALPRVPVNAETQPIYRMSTLILNVDAMQCVARGSINANPN